MNKNRHFKRRYVIEFKGITTNGFALSFLDKMFRGLAEAVAEQHKQINLTNFSVEGTANNDEDNKL